MSPRVSVIIPVYNRPAAVRRAIDSVLAQTFQDFELIIVDDGSTDGTPAALAAVVDPRVRVVRHPEQRGGSAARNTGIRSGSAPFIAFLDSDDEWLPTKLEKQIARFASAGVDVALVYSGSERVWETGADVSLPSRHADLARALLTENVIGETSVGMVRRSAIEAVGGFDESLPSAQEADLWLRICERFSADFVAEPLVRIEKGRADTISASIPATTRGRELFRNKHVDKLRRHGLLDAHLRESAWWYLRGTRDAASARRCCLEALRARPLSLATYALLTATFLPAAWLNWMSACKWRIATSQRGESRLAGTSAHTVEITRTTADTLGREGAAGRILD